MVGHLLLSPNWHLLVFSVVVVGVVLFHFNIRSARRRQPHHISSLGEFRVIYIFLYAHRIDVRTAAAAAPRQ